MEQTKKPTLKKVFQYEGMDYQYLQCQLNGLVMEISKSKEHQHYPYIEEKIKNMVRHFTSVVENFGKRMAHKECQEEFLKNAGVEQK